jgi:predicted NAD/FAD-binding protein
MRDYPARSFLAFFANHGLLTVGRRLAWRTVTGGARGYVDRLAADLRPGLRLATPIVGVRRDAQGIELRDGRGACHRFDQAVLACHADHSLAMIQDASSAERAILSAFRFQPNRAVLHRDPRLMPRRREVWASWNYLARTPQEPGARVAVTYWMNRLQGLDVGDDLFVSLNPPVEPEPSLVHGEFSYDHPVFDAAALAAQRRVETIQGAGGLWHAGAWLGHGFHEDGLRSAVAAAAGLGVAPPWAAERPTTQGAARTAAAWSG